MARLIDADKLVALLNKKYGDDENINEMVLYLVGAISGATTVDAVEVVRCKDCRWYENDGYHTNCQIMRFCVEAEDYCSRGERREDGQKN